MANGPKLPHLIRFILFLLRITLGLNFFYVGWVTLFSPAVKTQFSARSLGNLYAWIGSLANTPTGNFFAWAFLVIGACLTVGLFMRSMALAGIIFILMSYWPSVSGGALAASSLANDAVTSILSLLLLVFSNAGSYLGLDKFLHIHLSSQHAK